jgi:methylated-DNA-[protein]-cysteine S-methyltransferase
MICAAQFAFSKFQQIDIRRKPPADCQPKQDFTSPGKCGVPRDGTDYKRSCIVGQRSVTQSGANIDRLSISVFVTPLGQWALLGRGKTLWALTLGHKTATDARTTFANPYDGQQIDETVSDWHPVLRRRLERYSAGDPVTFEDIELRLPPMTPFRQQVIQMTRKLPYGAKLTYGELAEQAGHPRAARAVGSTMKTNRFPIIIPCHRVIGSGGGLGGYSAPQGLSLKQRLLELEAGY